MNTQQGFSLLEVLVSLLVITIASMAFLTQQWQARQLLNQVIHRAELSYEEMNKTERGLQQ